MIILHNVDFHADMYEKIKNFLIEKKIYKNPDKWGMEKMHFGNYCLLNVPDDLLPEILALGPNNVIWHRNTKHIVERIDLEAFKLGDKVTIIYKETDFFPVRNQKGTIDRVDVSKITGKITIVVRAYKHRTRGWFICEGDNCLIKKGWVI